MPISVWLDGDTSSEKKVAGSKTGLERYGSTIKFANLCWHHAQQGLCNQFASHPFPTLFPPFAHPFPTIFLAAYHASRSRYSKCKVNGNLTQNMHFLCN